MDTAKLFFSGKSQAVSLPKEYRFSGTEVGIKRLGEIVVLYPLGDKLERFLNLGPVTEDVGEAILEARQKTKEKPDIPREEL